MRIFKNRGDRYVSLNRIRTPSVTFWTVVAMLCAAATLPTSPSRAANAEVSDTALNEIIVTGTREVGIKAADSAAPKLRCLRSPRIRGTSEAGDGAATSVRSIGLQPSAPGPADKKRAGPMRARP